MARARDPVMKYGQVELATEQDIMLANTLHEYVNKHILVGNVRQNLDGGFHRDEELAEATFNEVVLGLTRLGCGRAGFPEKYGGLGPNSFVTYNIMQEELARGDIGISSYFGVNSWAFLPALMTNNKATLQRYAPMFCRDEIHHAAFEMTEPAGGCNMEDRCQRGHTIQTRAELIDGHWVINGQKIWASNTGNSEFYSTVCTTDPGKGDEGICIISVPKDTPGISFGKPEEKMGFIYTDRNASMYFDNAKVAEEYCTGRPGGEGARVFHRMLAARFCDGIKGVGAAQACLEIVEDYTKDRFIVGKPVRERAYFAAKIGEMAMKIRAARAYSLYVAGKFDHPEIYGEVVSTAQIGESSAAKVFATSTAIEVILSCIELMGSYGYSVDYHLERYLRDIIIVHLWMGGAQLGMLESAQTEYPFKPW